MSYPKPKGDTSIFSDALAIACGCRATRDYHPSADPQGLFDGTPTLAKLAKYFGRSNSAMASSSELTKITSDLASRVAADTTNIDLSHRLAAAAVDLPNFKPAVLMRLAGGQFSLRPSGAAAVQIDTAMAGERVKLANYAAVDYFTRELIVNSDFDMLAAKSRELVAAGIRSERALLMQVIEANTVLSDGLEQFHADRGNVVSGTLSIGTVAEAVAALRAITDAAGNALQLSPAVALVPAAHEIALRTILESAGITDLAIVADTRLTAVYLLPNVTANAPFTLAWLDGMRRPIVTTDRKPRSDDYWMKGLFDVAAAATSARAVKVTLA